MRIVLVLLVLFANAAAAEVISVRSGDHPTFTRLVLAIPVGRDWRLGRQGTGYAIDTGDVTDTFELAVAFEKIQRTRVAALTQGAVPGRLQIDLACACHAQAFLWQPDRVVIDIVEGPAPADSPYELALDASVNAPPTMAAARADAWHPAISGAIPQHRERSDAKPRDYDLAVEHLDVHTVDEVPRRFDGTGHRDRARLADVARQYDDLRGGAHDDHLGMGGSHSLAESTEPSIHFGADDNASGTAGVLEMAQYFGAHRDRLGRSIPHHY